MSKKRPLYRVTFSPYVENGDKTELASAIEIGAIWPRVDTAKGGILRLSIVPEGLKDGVIFIVPVTEKGGAQ